MQIMEHSLERINPASNTNLLWQSVRNALQNELKLEDYNMWILPLHVFKQQGDVLYIETPNDYFTKHIEKNHMPLINELLVRYSDKSVRKVVLASTFDQHTALVDEPLPMAGAEAAMVAKSIFAPTQKMFNNQFKFESFVVGKSNQIAFASAAQVVAKLGDATHNPFFIYGPTGLGKTHIMHAVANAVLAEKPDAKIVYLTSEQFVMKFTWALRNQQIDQFKHECRQLDLLLVDDIHLLAGKEATINEFFHTFNALIDNNKQIILTSDRYPKELTELDQRLISRFSWGLSVAVEPPDLNTRTQILLKKAEIMAIDLPLNVAQFIAQHVIANVRELEGALNRVMAMARFRGNVIDEPIAKEALKDIIVIRARQVGIDNIQKTVCEYYALPLKELIGSSRARTSARPRQLAMLLARELTDKSYPEIGKTFGGRDHSTVMHACEKMTELFNTNIALADDYKNLLRLLQN